MAASSALVDWSRPCIASRDVDVGHCRLNLAVLYSPEIAERFRRVYESEAGRQVEPWWDIRQLLAYGDVWPTFIPVQVAGRAPSTLPWNDRPSPAAAVTPPYYRVETYYLSS